VKSRLTRARSILQEHSGARRADRSRTRHATPHGAPTGRPRYRTFVHQEGKARHYDSALAAWTRHRVAASAPHYVYVLRLATGSLYVGITRADRLARRMQEHRRAAEPDRWPATPGAYFVRHHGWGSIERLELVPDRSAAWLTEAEWTCALAARRVEVFGQNPGDLCPGKGWRDARGGWGVDWQNPRTPTLCVDAAGRVTTALVG
jgi:predicted GIY-YIG superfamily endonuclease